MGWPGRHRAEAGAIICARMGGRFMYIRTMYVTGDPARIDEAVDGLTTEGQKMLSTQQGFRGLGLFVDREVGKLLIGT